jgi:predicted PolB exonuclease-like 3'-5' exonuclease
MCKALGLDGKPGDIDGSKVWDFVEAGKYEEVMTYNKYDVEQGRKVYKRLTFTS